MGRKSTIPENIKEINNLLLLAVFDIMRIVAALLMAVSITTNYILLDMVNQDQGETDTKSCFNAICTGASAKAHFKWLSQIHPKSK